MGKREALADAKQQLRAEHIPFDEKITRHYAGSPSVMFIIDQCCEEIDFFSIGSNDLTQYICWPDRDNAIGVTRHYNSLNPTFLRALDYAVQAVHRQGKWIGLCGELGAKGSVPPLCCTWELDELSIGSPAIPATKALGAA